MKGNIINERYYQDTNVVIIIFLMEINILNLTKVVENINTNLMITYSISFILFHPVYLKGKFLILNKA